MKDLGRSLMLIGAITLTLIVAFYTTMVRMARQMDGVEFATHPAVPVAPVEVAATCEVIKLPWVKAEQELPAFEDEQRRAA